MPSSKCGARSLIPFRAAIGKREWSQLAPPVPLPETELVAPKRHTRAEVQQLVAEIMSSGMRRSEFCRPPGINEPSDRV